MFGGGSNLPPGCRVSDIPGNSPEDERWESLIDYFFDKKRIRKIKYGIKPSKREQRALSSIYRAKKYERISGAVETYIGMAIEYGVEAGRVEADNINKDNRYYERFYIEERLRKILPEDTLNKVLNILDGKPETP